MHLNNEADFVRLWAWDRVANGASPACDLDFIAWRELPLIRKTTGCD